MSNFNKAELQAEIIRTGHTAKEVYTHIGISGSAWYRKINGRSEFTLGEIHNLIDYMGIPSDRRELIFFNQKVS